MQQRRVVLENHHRRVARHARQPAIDELVGDKVAHDEHPRAAEAVDAVIGAIKASLKKGDDVRLVGFGTFTVSPRAATTGRNPRTGEPIKIPASKQPKFKAGKELKQAINK